MRERKKETGFGLIELLVVVTIILIIAATAIPDFLAAQNRLSFKQSFAVELTKARSVTDEERRIIQPLVTKRIHELREVVKNLKNEKEALLFTEVDPTLEKVTKKEQELFILNKEIEIEERKLQEAESSASYYKFDTK